MPEVIDYSSSRYSPEGFLHEDAINRELMDNYRFLTERFGPFVESNSQTYSDQGERYHEYTVTIGDPMPASAVFGHGRSLEVGGPSKYTELRMIRGVVRPTIVTNIEMDQGVHEIADARKLPYPDASFSAVLAMGLPGRRIMPSASGKHLDPATRPLFIKEAYRVLEPGGWLVMEGAAKEEVDDALSAGFGITAGSGAIQARLTTNQTALQSGELIWSGKPMMRLEILMQK